MCLPQPSAASIGGLARVSKVGIKDLLECPAFMTLHQVPMGITRLQEVVLKVLIAFKAKQSLYIVFQALSLMGVLKMSTIELPNSQGRTCSIMLHHISHQESSTVVARCGWPTIRT